MTAAILTLFLGCMAGDVATQTRTASQPAAGTARIRGTLVDASTGTPVRRASMRLRAVSSTTNAWTTITDGNGGFEFPSLPAGRFSLDATKGGYVSLAANSRATGEKVQPIELSEGQRLDLPTIRLPRGGVITGRIRDEYGDSAPDIAVQAFRAEYMQGTRRLVSVRSGKTDDIGQYRIYGLQPGTYYVAASARGADGSPLQFMEPGSEIVPGGGGLAPTFYPGTVTAAEAQRIEVAAGSQSSGIDFALTPVRLASISGAIADAPGRPADSYAVMLNPARPDGALLGDAVIAETDADGRFRLANVAPADYRMDVYPRAFFERIAETGSSGKARAAEAWQFASVPISIIGEDVAGLMIKVSTGHSLTGRVTVEGAPANPQTFSVMRIAALAPIGGTSATLLAAHAAVEDDGKFKVPGLIGPRIIRVSGLPQGWTLKTVRADGVDVTDDGLDISTDVEIEVVVTTTPTHLAGVVTDPDGKLVAGASVIIFPEARERRSGALNRYVTTVRADGDGAFTPSTLPPGRYFAIARTELAEGEWAELAHLQELEIRAVRFTLSEGESKPIGLRIDRQ